MRVALVCDADSVWWLDLSHRIVEHLRGANICTVGELRRTPDARLLRIRGIGEAALGRIKAALPAAGDERH